MTKHAAKDQDKKPETVTNPDVQAPLSAPGVVVQPNPTPDTGEVRAGPGDVGASDSPRTLPKGNQYGAKGDPVSRTVLALGIGVPVVVLLAVLIR